MTQLADYVTAPYQGVSQAPPQVRLREQADMLEDALVAIPQGETKRPPFEYICKLGSHPGDTDGIFDRILKPDGGEAFVTITNEAAAAVPRVYEVDGSLVLAPETVTIQAAAQDYIDTGLTTPIATLNPVTVEDYTFLINRNINVANVATTEPARDKEAMIWVRQGAYARSYTVIVTPSGGAANTTTVHTPDGTAATNGPWIGTDVLATALKTGSYAIAGTNGATVSGSIDSLGAGWTISVSGSVIYIVKDTGDFTVEVKDDQAGLAMLAIKDEVQSFADLPKVAIDGFVTKITQTSGTEADDFYVKYVQSAGGVTGTWQETIAPGTNLGLDPETMPVGLYNDGAWKLDILDWKGREVGDADLVPDPDFIGQPIQDLSFWRSRLAVVSGEGVTLSSSSDPFRLYPRSLATVLATDSVSLLSPLEGRTKFRYAVHFDKSLVLFGNKGQAEVSAEGLATPLSIKIDKLETNFEFAQQARPQGSNSKVYFVAPRGTRYSTVYEMKINEVLGKVDGEDMTRAIPRYLPASVDRISNCPVNYLITYGISGGSSLYAHLFLYAGDGQQLRRVQNAWMRWNLPTGYTLGGAVFDNTRLYALLCTDTEAHLVVMDTSPDPLDEDSESGFTHLDLRLDESQVTLAYDSLTDETTITLPYLSAETIRVAVRAPGGVGGPLIDGARAELTEGHLAQINDLSTYDVVVYGDYTTVPFYVGHSYTKLWRLSNIYPSTSEDQPILSGRASLRRLRFNLADTGYLRVEVTARGRPTRAYEFSGVGADDPGSAVDMLPNAEATFSVPVLCRNDQVTIDVINDTHLRSKVLGFEWVCELNPKATKIGG